MESDSANGTYYDGSFSTGSYTGTVSEEELPDSELSFLLVFLLDYDLLLLLDPDPDYLLLEVKLTGCFSSSCSAFFSSCNASFKFAKPCPTFFSLPTSKSSSVWHESPSSLMTSSCAFSDFLVSDFCRLFYPNVSVFVRSLDFKVSFFFKLSDLKVPDFMIFC
jgi:hypothetical protein